MTFSGPYFYAKGLLPTLTTLSLLGLGVWKLVELAMQVVA